MENQKTLIDRLKSVNSNESLSEALDQLHDDCTKTTDFTFCYAQLFHAISLENPTVFLYNRLPEAWRVKYAEKNYHMVDPSWEHARYHLTPLYWSNLDTATLTKAQRTMMDDAKQHGLCSGVLIPFRGQEAYSLTWIMSSREELEIRNDLEHIHAYIWDILPFVFEATTRIVRYGNRSPLTKREAECLYWAAESQNTCDIAETLFLAPVTVEKHIASATTKLQARNRPHAVRIARDLGLLTAREITFNHIKELES